MRGLEVLQESVILDSIGLRVGDALSEERIRADVATISGTGWFADVTVRVEALRDGVRVIFLVVENPVISEIIIEGNTKFTTAQVLQILNVPTGQVFNSNRLREGARALEKLYEERGYVLARVADVGVVTNGGIKLRVRIAEGKVEAVEYKGLVKTRPVVVERQRLTNPGSIFNINDLNRDLQRLVSLELFENVQARPRPGSTPETVIVEVEVKEQRTIEFRFGLGYSDQSGILGLVSAAEKNWRGLNQRLEIRYERGFGDSGVSAPDAPPLTNFLISFREPYFDRKNTSLDISLYQTATTEGQYVNGLVVSRYTLVRTGSALALTRPVDPATSLTLRLRSEEARTTALPLNPSIPPCDTDPGSPACPKPAPTNFQDGRTIALALSGIRDRRDSRTIPTKGDRTVLSTDFGLPVLGGEFGFVKLTGEYTRYFPINPSFYGLFATRVFLGYGVGNIPAQDEYPLGGPSTLRAYPYARFRGTNAGFINLEYRLPLGVFLRQLRDITGVVFFDYGGAPLTGSPISSAIRTTGYGVGIGVLVNSAVGLIRVEYATGDEGAQTWLTFGQPF